MESRVAAVNLCPGYDTDEFELSSEGPRLWTRDTLRQIVERVLGRCQFIAVSNREPYVHRLDGDGVLLLSRFTGAAEELEQCLRVNPYSVDELAATLYQALCMEEPERRARMAALRETVARNDIYRWAGKIVSELGRIAVRRSCEIAA